MDEGIMNIIKFGFKVFLVLCVAKLIYFAWKRKQYDNDSNMSS